VTVIVNKGSGWYICSHVLEFIKNEAFHVKCFAVFRLCNTLSEGGLPLSLPDAVTLFVITTTTTAAAATTNCN